MKYFTDNLSYKLKIHERYYSKVGLERCTMVSKCILRFGTHLAHESIIILKS